MSDGVSVVICCHNSAGRLPETLRHLAAQQATGGVPWEVLVVDNASTDDTAGTARRCWPATVGAALRVVFEPRPGTGNARFRSFSQARYGIVSFVDDDNWVTPDWIAKVAGFFHDHPEVAAVGGPSKAVFETTAPAWFAPLALPYAVGAQHAFSGEITRQPGTLLWSAGMSLRKQDVIDLIHEGFAFLSCVDSSFARGEDTELCFALRAVGKKLYYDSNMAIEHFMPAERLVWPRVRRHMYVLGEAAPLTELYGIALDFPPFGALPAWRKTWLFRMLKVFWVLAQVGLVHPWACLLRPEGSRPGVKFQWNLGHFAALWKLRGRYRKLVDDLRHSAWAQTGRRRSAASEERTPD